MYKYADTHTFKQTLPLKQNKMEIKYLINMRIDETTINVFRERIDVDIL